MMIPIILLLLGLLLILFEFYLPGAIMGVLGAVSIVFSIILFAQSYALPLTLLFILVTIVSIVLLIKFAMWRIVHAKPDRSIYLSKDQEGYQASTFDATTIGKTGIVLSDLKPGGYIIIDGNQHQAISITGYISKGEKVVVLSGQEESLIVKSIKKEI